MSKPDQLGNPGDESQETPDQAEITRQLREMADNSEPTGIAFDPDKEITKADREKMKEYLELLRGGTGSGFDSAAMEMKIVDPSVDLGLDQEILERMKSELKHNKDGGNWSFFIHNASRMKIVDPSLVELDQEARKGMKNMLEMQRGVNWSSFSRCAMEMKIVDPSVDLGINQEARQGMKDKLEKYRMAGFWSGFTSAAMEMRIIDPSADLGLDQEAWQGMKGELESRRNRPKSGFGDQAMAMKIIAAEKVEVTDKGLEIKMPENSNK